MVRALASHQCGPGSNPGVDMWVEFVVGSLLCSARFFSGYSGFPLSPKTNTSKFQFYLERTDTEKRALELLGASWVNKLQYIFTFPTHYRESRELTNFNQHKTISLLIMSINIVMINSRRAPVNSHIRFAL